MSAALINPFQTFRKVYAEGARVVETPLERPTSTFVDKGQASIGLSYFRKQRRRMFRRLNHCAVPGFAPLCMDSNDPDTIGCAFKKRLLRDLPPAREGFLEEFRTFVKNFLSRHVPKVQPVSFEEWLQGTSYNEARKTELREAYESLRGGCPDSRQRSHIDTFVKTEFYTSWKHARMINSRCDAFKVWSGPRFKAIEEAVYSLPYFIKHTPVPKRPAAILALKFAGRRYYQTDFTAFESHFTPELLDACECELYRWCLSYDTEAEILCSTIKGTNRMRTRTGCNATVQGRRMSGDMCTSLGNGFTNLMLAMFVAAQKGGEIDGFVEGDDGLFATNVELTTEDYKGCGFTIKIDEVTDPCRASFCGMVFADSGEIIKDPYKFMQGFGWTSSFINAGEGIMDQLLRAKALSSVYETPQCPIIGAFSRYALSKTNHVTPRWCEDGFHSVPRDAVDIPAFRPAPDTRVLFEDEYGIPVATQLFVERLVSQGKFEEVSRVLPSPNDVFEYCSNFVVAD